NLLKKNLIKPVGRKELPGRPLAYGTTDDFLKYFGLNKLSDLPRLSEIKEFTIQHGE
ncbi:MAG TPA: SMC-Scp complex subunit ScpB, partial [Spirochaetota bacterium]|nr:SMC-Scp complex subunit ScpB [Spirochaetota bacterium]